MAEVKAGLTKAEYKGFYIAKPATTPVYYLLGAGVTALDENPNAQTETKAYINDKASTTDIVSYQWSFPFTAELLLKMGATEEAIKVIHDVPMNNGVGGAAILDLIIVNLYEPVEPIVEGVEPTEFRARRISVSDQVDNMGGAPVTTATMSGTLNGRGDPVWGVFDTTTKTFTAD